MTLQDARDCTLMIGDGGSPEVFTAIAPARIVSLAVGNRPFEAAALGGDGALAPDARAGMQDVRITVEGLHGGTAEEDSLRAAALARTAGNFRLVFPGGDSYEAAFIVRDYARGEKDGIESFSATLQRAGGGTYTVAS